MPRRRHPLVFVLSLVVTVLSPLRAGATPPHQVIIPPNNPRSNFSAPSALSYNDPLSVVNDARRVVEGLGPLPLHGPVLARWRQLPPLDAAFVLTNLERVSRGLSPAVGLSEQLDQVALTGALRQTDPSVQPVGAFRPLGSVWAQAQGPSVGAALLHADAGWLYSDGPPPYDPSLAYNIDCARVGDPGCWGHRDILLDVNPPLESLPGCTTTSLYLGVGFVKGSETQIVAQGCPTKVGALAQTWVGLVHRLGLSAEWLAPRHPYHAHVLADYFVTCSMSPTAPPNAPGALRVTYLEVGPGGSRTFATFGNGVTWYIGTTASGAASWIARLTHDPTSGAALPSPLTVRWIHGTLSRGVQRTPSSTASACLE